MRSDANTENRSLSTTRSWLDRLVIDGYQRDPVKPAQVRVRLQYCFERSQAQRVVIEYGDGSEIILPLCQ